MNVSPQGAGGAGPEPEDALPVGAVLRQRFHLVEVVGRGGMCTVYRAVDRMRLRAGAPEPEVAVKILRRSEALHEDMVELVHREARYLRELLHPNIVRVFDSDQAGTFHFVVMELLQGRPVGRILRELPERRLPIDLVLRIIASAAAGLVYAHRHGIIHGDLKPGNLFVTQDGDVKILDFGAAQLLDRDEREALSAGGTARIGAFTPAYASLETIVGEPPAESDDVYSLAVLAYVMLTGAHPFGGKTAEEALADGAEPIQPSGLSRGRWGALRRAMALRHRDRTATMAEFATDFARPPFINRLLG